MRPGRVRRQIVVIGVGALVLTIQASAAFAQYPGGGETPPQVRGERFFRSPGGTARTGQDILLLLVIAVLVLVAGFILHSLTRSRAMEQGD